MASTFVCAQIISIVTSFAASGRVAVHLSNRSVQSAACKANNVTHSYVTIADVKAHRSGGGGGFQSLIGNPTPAQFDLLFASNESEPVGSADCPIVGLGGTGLLPGKYTAFDSGDTPVPTNTVVGAVTTGSNGSGQFFPLTIPSGSSVPGRY